MTDLILTYPPKPADVDAGIIKPSKQFNKQVYSMLNALCVFFLTYITLLAGAVVIAILLLICGYGVMTLKASFITLALGLALAASGVMLVFFLIKFLFKKSVPVDYSDLVEITADEQPQLFKFIENLTREVDVDFPAHIYLSPEVNAGVFYNSTFWSMFLPTRKNLKIGLGLVNSVNQSEFKAVLAHEFGHFSQRSMKFGSYVYNLNKVLYNLLYDNAGYENALNKWARMHYILRLTAYINIYLIRGIQYILRKVYVLINKNHLKLSREMEFQADAISAYVSGSNQAISLLRRIELGQMCYDSLLDYWNSKLQDNQRADNIYPQHVEIIRYFAAEYQLKLDSEGLPVIDRQMAVLNNNHVSVDDQWSSHPTSIDRELFLEQLDIHTNTISQSAWALFSNPHELQKQVSDKLYAHFEREKPLQKVSTDNFKAMYETDANIFAYNKYYKGYYKNRNITRFNTNDVDGVNGIISVDTINALFNDNNCNLPKAISGMHQDIELLSQVISNENIQTFDYKGIKYDETFAPDITNAIRKEIKEATAAIEKLDRDVYVHFYHFANEPQKQALKHYYDTLFNFQDTATPDYELYSKTIEQISPFYQRMKSNEIQDALDLLYATEKELKPRIKTVMADTQYEPFISDEQRQALDKYLSELWSYFIDDKYDNRSLAVLNQAMDAYIYMITERNFKLKKDLLDYQINLLGLSS